MASASSSFTGTEGPPLSEGGAWSAFGAYWQTMRKANGAAVNASVLGNDCGARYTGVTFSADHYSEIVLAATPTGGQLFFQYTMVRSNATAGCYLVTTAPDVSSTTLQLYRVSDAGGYTQLGANITLGAAMAATDPMRLGVQGSTLTVTYKGAVVRTVTDANIATGQPAIGAWAQDAGSNVILITSWSAADVTASVSAPPFRRCNPSYMYSM